MNKQNKSNHQFNVLFLLLWCLFCFLFALGQLQRLEFGQVVMYAHDVIIALFLCVYTFTNINISSSFKASQLSHYQIMLLSFFSLLIARSVIASWQIESIIPLLYWARIGGYVYFAFAVNKTISATHISTGLLASIISIAWLGLVQFIVLPDTRFLSILGWDDHYYRLISTIFDPAFTGLLVLFGFILVLTTKLLNKYSKLKTVILVSLLFAIGLTFSRASWLATLVVSCLYFFKNKMQLSRKNGIQFLVGGVLIAIVGIIAIATNGEGTKLLRTSTITARITSQNTSFSTLLATNQLLLGSGLFVKSEPLQAEITYHPSVPDSIFQQLLIGGGIVGLVLGMYLILYALQYFNKHNHMLLLIFVGLLIHSIFNASTTQPFVVLAFLLLLFSEKDKQITL